ncbi:EAL domain-containing protein [uncultured Pseudoalteromonas sp.]|uniref:EAL domain-containing protein n=1 Tax=uncultured Pseudoalteromonas sp. TaxID=114053 RepID=UPI000C3828CD|nr:EAL domain-containing protein [uncultured Pseudoalteromonas sp.]MBD57651.1 hypothetical protein [Pseudoalteromonas sp.]|tara:strand:+ start:8369 stop:9847 length:1479 start_codon:yes stop_codon:yes gene_type:complete
MFNLSIAAMNKNGCILLLVLLAGTALCTLLAFKYNFESITDLVNMHESSRPVKEDNRSLRKEPIKNAVYVIPQVNQIRFIFKAGSSVLSKLVKDKGGISLIFRDSYKLGHVYSYLQLNESDTNNYIKKWLGINKRSNNLLLVLSNLTDLVLFAKQEGLPQVSDKRREPSKILEPCSYGFKYGNNIKEKNKAGLMGFPPYISVLLICLLTIISFLFIYSLISYLDLRRSIEFRLKRAIRKREIYLEYQPIVDVKTNKITSVESLVRWKDSIHGQVSPEQFLELAEQLSLYPILAKQCLTKMIAELGQLMNTDRRFSVAINVNSYEIQDPEFLDYLHQLCCKHKVNHEQIRIEITERIGLPLQEISCFALKAKTYGFKIALDDFGTGVSNLVWLTEINFDVIKIDKVFIQSIMDDEKQNMIVAIISLVTNLNRIVIFEGVETVEQYSFIRKYNKGYLVQGWYFYKSLSLAELLSELNNQQGKHENTQCWASLNT